MDRTPRAWWTYPATALAIAACVCALLWSGITWRIDAWLYDSLVAHAQADADERIVVVAVDDKSLAAFGRWPWPRGVHARLLERLQDSAPRGIGFDVMFSEPSSADAQGDRALVDAVARNGHVVLPVMAERTEPDGMPIEVLPMPDLIEAAAGLGHAAVDVDPDGVTRSAYLRAGLGEQHWPALAMALLANGGGLRDADIPGDRAGAAPAASPYLWHQDHRVLVPFTGGSRFQQVSYVDVIQGQVPPGLLRDRWLLVGVTAHGLGDSILTPLSGGDERMPGVLYQANLLNMLLHGTAVVQASFAQQAAFAFLLVLVPVLFLWRRPLRPAWGLGLGLASAVVILAGSAGLLRAGLWLPPAPALATLLLAFLLLAAYQLRVSHRLAHSDGLTRLANRRLFDLILHRECLAARRSGQPVSLLLIDVDHFKRYNDSRGHQAGDALLRTIADAVARHVGRPRDLSARYGGDELAAILPETPALHAGAIADAIVRDVASLAVPHPGNGDVPYASVSIGVAASHARDDDAGSLLERADAALYRAKELGRNRSHVASAWPG